MMEENRGYQFCLDWLAHHTDLLRWVLGPLNFLSHLKGYQLLGRTLLFIKDRSLDYLLNILIVIMRLKESERGVWTDGGILKGQVLQYCLVFEVNRLVLYPFNHFYFSFLTRIILKKIGWILEKSLVDRWSYYKRRFWGLLVKHYLR